jgi:hypothetical protein
VPGLSTQECTARTLSIHPEQVLDRVRLQFSHAQGVHNKNRLGPYVVLKVAPSMCHQRSHPSPASDQELAVAAGSSDMPCLVPWQCGRGTPDEEANAAALLRACVCLAVSDRLVRVWLDRNTD